MEVPAVIPVATPVTECTETAAGVPDVQVPPAGADDNVTKLPTHMPVAPVKAVGRGLTVTMRVRTQPDADARYDMVAVPAATPDTKPEPEPTVATADVEDTHVPGVVTLDNVVLPPTHTAAVPVIAAGSGCTVTVTERAHMVDNVY